MTRYLAALLVLLAMQFVPVVASAATGIEPAVVPAGCSRIGVGLYACPDKDLGTQLVKSAIHPTGACNNGTQTYQSMYWSHGTSLRNISKLTNCGPVSSSSYLFFTQSTNQAGCPSGTTWNEEMATCFDPSQCASRSPLGFSKYTGAVADGACSEGCKFVPDQLGISLGNDDGTWTTYFTGWKPSGEACAVGDPAPVPVTTAQDCKPAPDNQTFCIKPDGQHCYSLTNGSGRQICWRPGETGEKASDNALQVRNGGTTATTPATTPPPGDSFAQAGGSVTKTATVNGTNVTTTTTNYTTINGTSTGGTDSSEPGDGSGAPSGGGDGEGQGSASGGETCEAPPVCSGDPVGCAALAQQYAARCEAKSLFGVEGANTDTGAGMMEDASSLWGDGSGGSGALDEAGFLTAARVCPAPPSFVFLGMDRTIDTAGMCDIAAVVAALVLLIAFAQAAWIIGEQ